jgi:arylsulfatase A-like enzyme
MNLNFLLLFTAAPLALLAGPRPNIILIMADDMGYGDPSYVGNSVLQTNGSAHPDQGWIQTPIMDEMAADGLRFDRFYSASAVCSPTRASCLTGRNPYRVGVPHANSGKIGADETPLSIILAAEGYATGHFGKWHLGTMTTLRNDSNRGTPTNLEEYSAPWHFDYDVCFATESKVPTFHPYRKTTNGLALPTAFTIDPTIGYKITDANFYGTHYWEIPQNPETAAEGSVVPISEVNNAVDGDDSKLITDEAITFIQGAVAEEKPFFVVLWYHTPHKPLVDPDGVSGVDSSDAAKDGIEDLDAEIGNLRAALTTLGVRDDTMLWLTSDNGPENGVNSPNETDPARSVRSGGLRERKRSFYEGGIRVPGILEWPNGITNPGRSTAFLSSTSDYYTTILDYLNLSAPNQKALDGLSLRPVIDDLSETRSSPIGFLIGAPDDNQAWMNQDYKLVRVGSQWELYDMTLPDHQLELTALATASNVGTKTQEIQDIYNAMLADYTTWKATVDNDTVLESATAPTSTLSAASSATDTAFTLTVNFGLGVTGLSASDFVVSGGYANTLTGSGSCYSLQIQPSFFSDISVRLPQGATFAADGTPSRPSNELLMAVTNAVIVETVESTLDFDGSSYTTVDSENLSPATGNNNVDKFSVSGGGAFDTTLYVRSNSIWLDRRVQALLQFDLSGLDASELDVATLHLRGYSLNADDSVSLQAVAAAADWSEAPAYGIATQGVVVAGGDVTARLDGSLTRSYAIDVTDMVKAWLDGSATNYGILLKLSSDTINNGVGIQLSGDDAPSLDVSQAPLKILRHEIVPQSSESGEALSLIFQGTPGVTYYLHESLSLSSDWADVDTVTPEAEVINFTVPRGNKDTAFYRVSTESIP